MLSCSFFLQKQLLFFVFSYCDGTNNSITHLGLIAIKESTTTTNNNNNTSRSYATGALLAALYVIIFMELNWSME